MEEGVGDRGDDDLPRVRSDSEEMGTSAAAAAFTPSSCARTLPGPTGRGVDAYPLCAIGEPARNNGEDKEEEHVEGKMTDRRGFLPLAKADRNVTGLMAIV